MDAREYMARKGIEQRRDQERPNTLEEKAWSRAREAGDHRPRVGTPHDWEDWERHHVDLAEGAEAIVQKIDHEAHSALVHERGGSAVQQFTPPATEDPEPRHHDAGQSHRTSEPRLALFLLAVLMPPLAVALGNGGGRRTAMTLLLTLLGWLPGVGHALWWLRTKRN
jgi:uncharacterized membrane protein YqaE (UPF0057 family)